LQLTRLFFTVLLVLAGDFRPALFCRPGFVSDCDRHCGLINLRNSGSLLRHTWTSHLSPGPRYHRSPGRPNSAFKIYCLTTLFDLVLSLPNMYVDGNSAINEESNSTGPWFDHEYKLPNRPLFRNPEALALWVYTVNRPLIEGVIMIRISPGLAYI